MMINDKRREEACPQGCLMKVTCHIPTPTTKSWMVTPWQLVFDTCAEVYIAHDTTPFLVLILTYCTPTVVIGVADCVADAYSLQPVGGCSSVCLYFIHEVYFSLRFVPQCTTNGSASRGGGCWSGLLSGCTAGIECRGGDTGRGRLMCGGGGGSGCGGGRGCGGGC